MNNATVTHEEVGQLRRDFDRLRSDLHQFRTDVSELREDAVRAAKTGASEAAERIGRGVKSAAAKGRETVEAVEGQIGEHPFMSLAAACALGLVVGLALSRKD